MYILKTLFVKIHILQNVMNMEIMKYGREKYIERLSLI